MVYTKNYVNVVGPLYIILEGHGLLIPREAKRADDWQMVDFEAKNGGNLRQCWLAVLYYGEERRHWKGQE